MCVKKCLRRGQHPVGDGCLYVSVHPAALLCYLRDQESAGSTGQDARGIIGRRCLGHFCICPHQPPSLPLLLPHSSFKSKMGFYPWTWWHVAPIPVFWSVFIRISMTIATNKTSQKMVYLIYSKYCQELCPGSLGGNFHWTKSGRLQFSDKSAWQQRRPIGWNCSHKFCTSVKSILRLIISGLLP